MPHSKLTLSQPNQTNLSNDVTGFNEGASERESVREREKVREGEKEREREGESERESKYLLCSRKWARPGRSSGSLKLPTPTHRAAAD